jgi:hypothetical protein
MGNSSKKMKKGIDHPDRSFEIDPSKVVNQLDVA